MKKNLIDKFKDTIDKYSMIPKGCSILVGLSGGADSVCLLSILNNFKNALGFELSACYVDHGLRPAEIPAETEFCRKICNGWGISLIVRKIDPKSCAEKEHLNLQDAARELRYKALEDVSAEIGANKIALAHNADDQAETVLMHLIRGSGTLGLSGIPPVRGHIIRPIIEIERTEIEDFLAAEGLDFITDSSNLKDNYLRNRIRHFLVPAIKDINRNFAGTVSRTAGIFREEERYWEIMVTKTLMKMISRKTDASIELFLAPMEYMDNVLLRRVLRRALSETKGLRGLGLEHIEDVMKLIKTGKSGDRIYLPHDVRSIKLYSTMLLTCEMPAKLQKVILEKPGEVVLKESALVIRSEIIDNDLDDDFGDGIRSACFDADKLSFPLIFRSREKGDYFIPLGFGKRKKLQDYFVDRKVPRDERDIVPLLVSGNDIVWIVGHRIDDRYKVDDNTTRVMRLETRPMKI